MVSCLGRRFLQIQQAVGGRLTSFHQGRAKTLHANGTTKSFALCEYRERVLNDNGGLDGPGMRPASALATGRLPVTGLPSRSLKVWSPRPCNASLGPSPELRCADSLPCRPVQFRGMLQWSYLVTAEGAPTSFGSLVRSRREPLPNGSGDVVGKWS